MSSTANYGTDEAVTVYTNDATAETPTEDPSVGSPEEPVPTFLQRVNSLKVILFLMFMIGFVAATPSSIIPQLQQDAFGNSSFVVTGGFSAGKGALGCVVIPLYGSLSDTMGRKNALIIAEALTILPYCIFLLTNNFWAYTIGDMLVGFHDGTMTLLLAAVADHFPQRTGYQLDSFSLAVACFFLGIAIAPFLGAFLNPNPTFAVCAGLMLATVLFTIVFYKKTGVPKKKKKPAQQQQEQGALLAGSNQTDDQQAATASVQVAPTEAQQQQQDDEEDSSSSQDPLEEHQPLLKEKRHLARLWEALKSSPDLRIVTIIIFANGLAENVLDNLLLLYFDNTLNFSATEQSIVIAILGVGSVFGLILVNGLLRVKFGSLGTLRIELVANVVICALYSFVVVHWGIFLTTGLSVIGMGVFPCACAIAAMCLRDEAAGLAQGVASAARMASSGVGPLAFGFIFEATQNGSFPGVAFLVASGCVLIGFVLTRFLTPRFFSKSL